MPDDNAIRWAVWIEHPFHFQARDHVWKNAIAELSLDRCIKSLVTGGHDDGANLQIDDFIFLVKIDGFPAAPELACPAMDAMLRVDDRYQGNCLRVRHVDRVAWVIAIIDVHRAHVAAIIKTTGTFLFIHETSFLAHAHGEFSSEATNLLDRGESHQRDVWMLLHAYHFGPEHADRAIERRKGFIKQRHVPADSWLAFYQVGPETSIAQGERGLDASNATTNDNGGLRDRAHRDIQWYGIPYLGKCHVNLINGFLRRFLWLFRMNPRILFPDVCEFNKEPVDAQLFCD